MKKLDEKKYISMLEYFCWHRFKSKSQIFQDLSVQWIDREHFVEPSMMGFRLVKKTKIEKKQN